MDRNDGPAIVRFGPVPFPPDREQHFLFFFLVCMCVFTEYTQIYVEYVYAAI